MSKPENLTIVAELNETDQELLTTDVLSFLCKLVEEFQPKLSSLLELRHQKQSAIDAGKLPDFLQETSAIRKDKSWKIAQIPRDLRDRRVEITGPVDSKMIINALNSGAKAFMACFEDATSPTWRNLMDGQNALLKANLKTLTYTALDSGKEYRLNENTAVLIVRPRGLHLPEKHLLLGGNPIPACLFDFAIYAYLNHKARTQSGSGLYFYLPKLESYQEARWWDEVFSFCESYLDLKKGTIKATVLIETLPAVFEMEEILYELKDHIVGMNCGRWDYIFSYIKTLKNYPDRVLPDRQQVSMDKPFLNAYSRLLIHTCHKRGAIAMGGMSAFIPSKDPKTAKLVLDKVRSDKELEASNGHDGTWVAHPGLVDLAMEVFNQYIKTDNENQLCILRNDDPPITAADLLEPCEGERSESGMRVNIRVALHYLSAWLEGKGCVPIYGLMEDAATCEIARVSIWQMIKHKVRLDSGVEVSPEVFRQYLSEEAEVVRKEVGNSHWDTGKYGKAVELLDHITTNEELIDFLTIPAYQYL